MKKELTEEKFFAFTDEIDNLYEKKCASLYSKFALMNDCVIPRETIPNMYQQFRTKFPQTHGIFSLIALSGRHHIELDNKFYTDQH